MDLGCWVLADGKVGHTAGQGKVALLDGSIVAPDSAVPYENSLPGKIGLFFTDWMFLNQSSVKIKDSAIQDTLVFIEATELEVCVRIPRFSHQTLRVYKSGVSGEKFYKLYGFDFSKEDFDVALDAYQVLHGMEFESGNKSRFVQLEVGYDAAGVATMTVSCTLQRVDILSNMLGNNDYIFAKVLGNINICTDVQILQESVKFFENIWKELEKYSG